LQQEIDNMKQSMVTQIPESVLAMMRDATDALAQSGLVEQALKAGDVMPDFDLPVLGGGHIQLTELLKNGPVVINFYRGGWCPYCNLEMQALQQALPGIEQAGGTLISIAPELPEHAGETREKGNLTFPLLHDRDNALARQCGLVFTLPDILRPVYEGFGIDLQQRHGNDHFELPIPATYIVLQDRTIAYAWVEVDYTKRLDPTTIVEMLEQK